ncbi:DNA pilot protein [Blackfly microvirus SF02]|uniref:DNA pilot protein n=1 Tax=Blackfly microvirus SF02 TaxID=2576452 RepID=A0A4P8PKT5_9VIRU|nr:DNA pilot protein [Blackfly microvirus SF02]
MALADFLGPIGDIASSIVSGVTAHKEAKATRNFEERMSNTAYQRQVKDLQAAGLNPMLGYMKGSGASTPSGATAPGVKSDLGGSIQRSVANSAERNLLHEQSIKTQSETTNLEADSKLKDAQRAQVDAQTRLTGNSADNANQQFFNLSQEYDNLKQDLENAKSKQEEIKVGIALGKLDIKAREAGLPELQAYAQAWRNHPNVMMGVREVERAMPAISGVVSSAAAAAAAGKYLGRGSASGVTKKSSGEGAYGGEMADYLKNRSSR